MKSAIEQESKKGFWRGHIHRAREYSGTDRQYCSEHGLNPGTLSGYKKRLGMSVPHKGRRKIAFSKVRVVSGAEEVGRSVALPDARWLATFLKAWVG